MARAELHRQPGQHRTTQGNHVDIAIVTPSLPRRRSRLISVYTTPALDEYLRSTVAWPIRLNLVLLKSKVLQPASTCFSRRHAFTYRSSRCWSSAPTAGNRRTSMLPSRLASFTRRAMGLDAAQTGSAMQHQPRTHEARSPARGDCPCRLSGEIFTEPGQRRFERAESIVRSSKAAINGGDERQPKAV